MAEYIDIVYERDLSLRAWRIFSKTNQVVANVRMPSGIIKGVSEIWLSDKILGRFRQDGLFVKLIAPTSRANSH